MASRTSCRRFGHSVHSVRATECSVDCTIECSVMACVIHAGDNRPKDKLAARRFYHRLGSQSSLRTIAPRAAQKAKFSLRFKKKFQLQKSPNRRFSCLIRRIPAVASFSIRSLFWTSPANWLGDPCDDLAPQLVDPFEHPHLGSSYWILDFASQI